MQQLVLVILVPGDIAEAATICVAASEAALVAAGTADYDFVATDVAADYIVAVLGANVSNTHFS
jgi:hypothetical protein